MDVLKVLWFSILFFFTLILIFTWGKILVIGKKVSTLVSLIKQSESVELEPDPPIQKKLDVGNQA